MKSIQLNLAKKLLIIDYESTEKLDHAWHINSDPKIHTFHSDGSQVIGLFNGLELTEKNYRSLIEEEGGISVSKHPLAYKVSYCRHKNAFVDLIEKEGFYWLDNPFEEPTMSKYGWYASGHPEEDSGWMYEEGEEKYYEALKEFNDAESLTLKYPIIFEILEE